MGDALAGEVTPVSEVAVGEGLVCILWLLSLLFVISLPSINTPSDVSYNKQENFDKLISDTAK